MDHFPVKVTLSPAAPDGFFTRRCGRTTGLPGSGARHVGFGATTQPPGGPHVSQGPHPVVPPQKRYAPRSAEAMNSNGGGDATSALPFTHATGAPNPSAVPRGMPNERRTVPVVPSTMEALGGLGA